MNNEQTNVNNSEIVISENEAQINPAKLKVKKDKAKKSESKKDSQNLDALLSKFVQSEKGLKSSESIYKDSSYLKSFDGGKSFRRKMRNELGRKTIAVISALRSKNSTDAKKAFSEFNKFYSENYKRNDFSISSLYGGKENSGQYLYLVDFLNIIKVAKESKLI